MATSDDQRTTLWYYRIAGGPETGPVLTGRLRQMARRGQLAAEDLVRKGRMGEWVAAGTIEDLPVKPRPKRAAPAGAGVAAPTAAGAPPREDRGGSFAWERFVYWYYDTLQGIVERGWLIRRVAGAVALVVVAAILVRLTVPMSATLLEPPPADPYATFDSLWGEIKEMRRRKAGEAEWKELAERGRREIAPLVASLQKEASSTNRVAQMLLWAGRDCLPKMFDDSREEPSRSEKQFAEYMGNVVALRENQPIYGGNAGATHWYDAVRAEMYRPWYIPSRRTAPYWIGGAVIALVATGWFTRRWWLFRR